MKPSRKFVATLVLGVGAVGFTQGCSGANQATQDQVTRVGDAANQDIEDAAAGPKREAKYLELVGPNRASIAAQSGVDEAKVTDDDLLRSGYAMCELVKGGEATWDDLRKNAQSRLGADAEAVRVRLVIIDGARSHLC